MSKNEVPTSRCPLCENDNRCAIAGGRRPASCWCQSVDISAGVMQAIPTAEKGQRCLCQACAAPTQKSDQ